MKKNMSKVLVQNAHPKAEIVCSAYINMPIDIKYKLPNLQENLESRQLVST